MKKPLNEIPGTIAYHFTQNMNKLWACGDNIEAMRKVALELLEDPSLKDKTAVLEAKKNLSTARTSSFCSTLVTYMTGQKV